MRHKTRIVLLNGVGSVGKSSIARALQAIAGDPYLHVQMDAFLEMMPAEYHDHPDGYIYETVEEDGMPSVVITTGPVGERTLRGMRHAVAAMAGQGLDLIVDDVLLDGDAEYRGLLSGFDLFVVSVVAPLAVLEERERSRGDRLIGLARWQFDRVHRGMHYDLEVDTSQATPEECAVRIKERFKL